ncbi:MAG TPA: hydroxyacylglutathione hydrolase [Solimonas sp.]|nr:hydroxyacylglutathione hydrolase [Solimonas sp.]
MEIFPIPAFTDNYIWTLVQGRQAAVMDPGEAAPVLAQLAARGLQLAAILLTHHHGDHVGGVPQLAAQFEVPVYGPRAESHKIRGVTRPVGEGDAIEVLGLRLHAMEIPGHTLGHIAFHGAGDVFCGDTLFSAGCGRLFEGTPAQMHASLSRLAELPAQARVYCGHEYTRANLAFAAAVEPGNPDVEDYIGFVDRLRMLEQPSLPSSIELERRINPFLRTQEPVVRAAAERWAGKPLETPVEVFAALRSWKDGFKG